VICFFSQFVTQWIASGKFTSIGGPPWRRFVSLEHLLQAYRCIRPIAVAIDDKARHPEISTDYGASFAMDVE
jgi:hypothetical protein